MTQEKLPQRKELCLQSESSMSTLRSGPRLILKAKIVQIRLK